MKKQNKNVITEESFEPRWFIWTITFLIAVGVSLSGYIIISAEKESAQAAEIPLPLHIIKK